MIYLISKIWLKLVKKKWDQNDVVAVSVLILQFSSWISNIKLDIELLARLLFFDDLRDFEIFPRVDVGSFKPLHTNRPQNNIAIIIRTQIPIKPAIKLFWFFKSVSVKSEIKDTFLGSDSMNLDFRARPCRNTMRINIPKLLDLLIFCIYRRGAFTNYVCI